MLLPPSPLARAARPARAALIAGLALAALPLAGCDNPACVFGGDCDADGASGGNAPGANAATLPVDGEWLKDSAPSVTQFLPAGTMVAPSSPVVIVFSESLAPATLQGAFVLAREDDLGGGIGGPPPVPLEGALVGNGRVAVLFPLGGLQPDSTYRVELDDGAEVTDLTGQELVGPLSGVLGTFTVAADAPAVPQVLATWPPEGATGASTLTEVVVVFDRDMNPATVTGSSFEVLLDGADPEFDPPPQVLTIADQLGGGVVQPSVFTWQSVNGAGEPQPLGTGTTVEVTLSPAGGGTIESEEGDALPETTFSFQTADFALPESAEILSGDPLVPDDAIGVAQLDGTAPLMILVDLAQPAAEGDQLGVYVFGNRVDEDPGLTVLSRTVDLTAGDEQVVLEEDELDLVDTVSPLAPRLADGTVSFAFRVIHDGQTSPVRVLDADPDQPGIQDPVLDTEPPELQGLGLDGAALDLRSSLPDLVVTGLASERVRAVEVEAMLLGSTPTNGSVPPVVGSDASGRFVAAPIPLGLIDPAEGTIPITVTIFDGALNASQTVAGTYTQVGAVGPGAALPGPDVLVRVLDATTLAPIDGALVLVHQDDGGVVTPVASGTTVGGEVTLASAGVGQTLVTVDSPGHDLFTFQGLGVTRLDVLLEPQTLASASVALGVTSPLEDLELLDLVAADSRRPRGADPTVDSEGCFFNPFTGTADCGFTPFAVRPQRGGALSVFAINPSAGNGAAFASTFLKAFRLVLPVAPAAPGATQPLATQVTTLLDAVGADEEEAAIDVAPHALLGGMDVPGLDSSMLVEPPRVTVQGLAPGIPGAVYVGLGKSFSVTPDTWTVRAAYPGAADFTMDDPDDALGELVELGTIEPDLFLEAELEDASGNRAGARPRLSSSSLVLDPPAVPQVVTASDEGGAGSLAFQVEVEKALTDADGMPGLYRVELVDADGRAWELWIADPADAAGATVVARFPDVAALGGTGLAATGGYTAGAALFAWPGLDAGSATGGFLWSEVPRERQLFSSAAAVGF